MYGTLLILCLLAWHNRFIQDDAFISFRYAQHLASGYGLVWNINEPPVEGYTNFLWTILIAIGIKLHLEPIIFSQLLGMASYFGTLLATFALARLLFSSFPAALISIILLGTNYSFSAYATGGLETQLHTMLLTTNAYLCVKLFKSPKLQTPSQLILFSAISAFAFLTRLDASVYLAPLYLLLIYSIIRSDSGRRIQQIISLSLPFVFIVSPWIIWKYQYYGHLLPNTFYAKFPNSNGIHQGLSYVRFYCEQYLFLHLILLWLIIKLLINPFSLIPKLKPSLDIFCLLSISILWLAYVVRSGGDHMEFRFVIAISPIIFIAITQLILSVPLKIRPLLILTILAGSIVHQSTFYAFEGLASIHKQQEFLTPPDIRWIQTGQQLRQLFPNSSITIAVTPAGAIPFYSQHRAIDMLGLNDAWIPQHGLPFGTLIGHQKISSPQYLIDQHVNLVIAMPLFTQNPQELTQEIYQTYFAAIFKLPNTPYPGSRLLNIPVNNQDFITVLYLTPHPDIDHVIQTANLPNVNL